MNDMYTKKNQRRVVTALLDGVTKIDGETIIETNSKAKDYFAKGHLAPDANFVYEVLQDATYYFINVAPQFQSFNGGNWKALELDVRNLATRLKRDLQVTTGTFGILEYPDAHQRSTSIFLSSSSYVPAPKLFWKVVLDPATGQSAAFMGLNDPHATVAPKNLCKNRCIEMSSWLHLEFDDLDSGYVYCCSVPDAHRIIKSMPAVPENSRLLTGISVESPESTSQATQLFLDTFGPLLCCLLCCKNNLY